MNRCISDDGPERPSLTGEGSRNPARSPRLRALLVAGLLLLAVATVAAQSGEGYDLSWSTVDGGGETSTGAAYTLSGTAGQPEAGVLEGGAYRLAGGFWPGGVVAPAPAHRVYLPLVVCNR